MIERAIVAMREEDPIPLSMFDDEELHALIRAVLHALREPTRAMREAGYQAMLHTDFTGPQETVCWQAMIDAALEKEPTDGE